MFPALTVIALAYTPYGVVLDLLVAVPLEDNLTFHVAVAKVPPFFVAIALEAVNQHNRVDTTCLLFVFVPTEH